MYSQKLIRLLISLAVVCREVLYGVIGRRRLNYRKVLYKGRYETNVSSINKRGVVEAV